MERFYKALDSLVKSVRENSVVFIKGQRKVNIVHIGDSHIQADYLSGETRKRLQSTFGNGGRGFVFPYKIANSNGPADVHIENTGNWSSRNVLRGYETGKIGACGYNLSCSDSSLLKIALRKPGSSYYGFNKLTIFERNGVFLPESISNTVDIAGVRKANNMTYSSFLLNRNFDSLTLISETPNAADFQGVVFENKYPGVVYHAMGVNGASTLQYLRNTEFEYQISEMKADLLILSFGTNDAYLPGSRFCSDCVKDRYREIIRRVRNENPSISILITIPPDSYYRRRYDNGNLKYFRSAMYDVAKEQNVALWDLYTIMGGSGSIMNWYYHGLARGDLIHFTERGYQLQGRLLYEAIIAGYEDRFN